jgi:hypothetical protein
MKSSRKSKDSFCPIESKNLSLGELIASTYDACGEQRAPKILQLAIDSKLIRFKGTM